MKKTIDDSSVEQVITHIRSKIINGTYPANSKLLPKLIAEECGTSFIPVREAMRALEVEGLVLYIHNRGVWVSPISIDDLDDLYKIRIEIESNAILNADKFTSAEISRLKLLLSQMFDAKQKEQNSKIIKLNYDFHFALYKKSNSPRRLKLIEQLWAHAIRYQRMSLLYRHDAADTEHQAIIDFVEIHDHESAARALAEHLETSARLVRAGLMQQKYSEEKSNLAN